MLGIIKKYKITFYIIGLVLLIFIAYIAWDNKLFVPYLIELLFS